MQFIRKNNMLMNKLLHHEIVLRALVRHKFPCSSEWQDDISVWQLKREARYGGN